MRYWRVAGNFHTIGEVVKVVSAPNWQGGLRKGALAIKGDPRLKGRRISMASFTVQEAEALSEVAPAEQLPMASEAAAPPETPETPEG